MMWGPAYSLRHNQLDNSLEAYVASGLVSSSQELVSTMIYYLSIPTHCNSKEGTTSIAQQILCSHDILVTRKGAETIVRTLLCKMPSSYACGSFLMQDAVFIRMWLIFSADFNLRGLEK